MRRSKHRHLEDDEVVDAAVGVAFDTGLHAVSAQSIGERLGAPAGSVSAVRPDAEALVAVTFSRIVAAELAEVKRAVLANPSPHAQLAVLLEALARPDRVEVDAVWGESWSLGRRNPALAAAVRSEEGAWHAFVAAVLRRGVRSGDFPEVDADEVAAHLLATVDGVDAHSLVGYGGDLDRLRLLRAVVRAHLGTEGPAPTDRAPQPVSAV